MAIPYSIQGPERKTREAVIALGDINREIEVARRSGDEDRIKSVQEDFKSKASNLEVAAKILSEAARRL